MRYFWYVLAMFALCALAVIVFFENLPKMIYNAFHKEKKKIVWELMTQMDDTESYYHK